MRRTRRYMPTLVGPALCAALLLGACGGTDDGDPAELGDQLTALNLETGERQSFDSKKAVPIGWAICADVRCIVPPSFPCTELGPGACLLSDERCQLKLRCEFDISGGSVWQGITHETTDPLERVDYVGIVAEGSPDNRYGAPPSCEFACAPQQKPSPTCEDILQPEQCERQPDCQWEPLFYAHETEQTGAPGLENGVSNEDSRSDGTSTDVETIGMPCPPDVCIIRPRPDGICVPMRPAGCEALDRDACNRRDDCDWDREPCDLICVASQASNGPTDEHNGYCTRMCEPSCRPAADDPPVCDTMPAPFCQDGYHPVQVIDDNDCVVGYECKPIPGDVCKSIPEPRCPAGELLVRIIDDNECVVGYECKPILGNDCDQIAASYAETLRDAKQCTPGYSAHESSLCRSQGYCPPQPISSCDLYFSSELACGCSTAVNPYNREAVSTLRRLIDAWTDNQCGRELLCPAMACTRPQGSDCGEDGTCFDFRGD